jgi:hypothetical protein
MPYGNGPSVKKLSKMSTLLLARNYILTLTKNMEQLKFCVAKVCMEQRKPIPPIACTGSISPLIPGSVGLLGTSLDLPSCSPMSSPTLISAADRAAAYRSTIPHNDHVTHRISALHGDAITQMVHERDNQIRHNLRSSNNLLLQTLDNKCSVPLGQYPEHTSDITSHKQLKITCKSRAGKQCFCVECLTKK